MPDTDSTEILQRLSRIEALLESEGARCPYREALARAANSIEERKKLALRVESLEEHVVDVRITLAKLLATGGAGGILGALAVEIVKQIPSWVK